MALVVFCAKSPNVEYLKRASERTFRLGGHHLTLHQRWRPGGDGGTLLKHGASVYDAAFVLADYLWREGIQLEGKRVVELGTGPGLGAIAAALCGAAEVVATDGDAELLSLTAENLDLNVTPILGRAARDRCRCAQLLWGDDAAAVSLNPPFDIVLAADCAAVVYAHAFRDLVSSLVALSTVTSTVLLSYHRRHKEEDAFFVCLRQRFSVHLVPSSSIHPDFADSGISLFALRLL
jgi:predicted nicotinamide N-methyase